MGAGGITEMIACVKAVQTGMIPPNVGLEQPDPECPVNVSPNLQSGLEIEAAMSNALGFGGQNSCVIIGKVS